MIKTGANGRKGMARWGGTPGGGDNMPDAFSFVAATAVELSTLTTSNTITPIGYSTPAAISVTGGEYSINGGAFTSLAGTINPADTVAVRGTSSASQLTLTAVTLSIGGVNGVFNITTGDATPAAFTFVDVTDQVPSATITSAAVTITGLTISSPITVSGDTGAKYSINGGAFTASAGTVVNNDQVRAQVTASASNNTATAVTVSIGGVSDTFTATTGVVVTWSPTDFPVNTMSLDVTNLIVTRITTTSNQMIRATRGFSSGKWQWETVMDAGITSPFQLSGIATLLALQNYPGSDLEGYGFYEDNGNKYRNAAATAYGNSWKTNGKVISTYLDMDNLMVWWGIDGTVQNSGDPLALTNAAFTIAAGTYYPAWSLYRNAAPADQITGRFKASALQYPLLAGYMTPGV